MVPPMVAPGPKWGGSKGSIWPCSASADSMLSRLVPQRAVTTSSLGW